MAPSSCSLTSSVSLPLSFPLSFPLSLLLLPLAALLGVCYVSVARVRHARLRGLTRLALLATTWALPLATRGPGPAELSLGLLVGFLGVRMVALGQRWRAAAALPSAATILAAMVTPEELLAPASDPMSRRRAAWTLLEGCATGCLCVALLVLGNEARLWRVSRFGDDMLVFAEVAVGARGVHLLLVGVAGLAGRSVVGLQDRPSLSASLAEFWARRWNHLVQGNLDCGFFRPYARRRQWALGTLAAFSASGIMHVIAVLDPGALALTLGPSLAVMAFFLIHAGLVLGERALGWHRPPPHPGALLRARFRTVATFALLSPLLLDPFANVVHVHGRHLGDLFGRW